MSTWTEVLQGMGVVTGKRPRQQKKRGGGSSAEDDAMMASVVDKMKSKFGKGAKGLGIKPECGCYCGGKMRNRKLYSSWKVQ